MTASTCLAAAAGDAGTWFEFTDIFWLTIFLVVILGVVGAFLRMRQRDKCLKLLRDFHVTYLGGKGITIWGDLIVVNRGLEVVFDAPFRTRRGFLKSSALLYEDEYKTAVAVCRTDHGLSPQEKRDRREQIRRTFNPNVFRRAWRWVRNALNTVRDALSKSFSMITGQISRTSRLGTAVTAEKTELDTLGEDLLGYVGNAYEQLLEHHIGRPVVLEIRNTSIDSKPLFELPGYLVDYSDQFLAVFNVDHDPVERFEIRTRESTTKRGVVVTLDEHNVTVTCDGPEAVVLHTLESGGPCSELAVVLLKGCSVILRREKPDAEVALDLETTRSIDVVCPRAIGRVRFGSEIAAPEEPRRRPCGVAPELDRIQEEAAAAVGDSGATKATSAPSDGPAV